MTVEILAPAKINLTLHIVRKREDGFHELDSLFARTSLADRLVLKLTSAVGLRFLCSDASLPTDDSNLVVRAARLLLQESAVAEALAGRGVEIALEKRVPSGGGLGGGSSDAASTLSALNELLGTPVSAARLHEIAAGIGSDVPFFLGDGAAQCRGRGELIEPLSEAARAQLPKRALLINPGFGVPTPWAYKSFAALPLERKKGEVAGQFPWGEMRNDLECSVFEKYLLLPEIKRWLNENTEMSAALMSGSGSTMFALLAPGEDAEKITAAFRAKFGAEAFVAGTSLS